MTTRDDLRQAQAIDALHAVCVRTDVFVGHRITDGLYAFHWHTPDAWFVVRQGYLASEAAGLLANPDADPSDACTIMPNWWSPRCQFAVREINSGRIVPDAVLRGSPLAYQGVTADLETGEIIAANLANVPRSQIYGADAMNGDNVVPFRRVQPNPNGGRPTDPLVLGFEGSLEGEIICEDDAHLDEDWTDDLRATLGLARCIWNAVVVRDNPRDRDREMRACFSAAEQLLAKIIEREQRLKALAAPQRQIVSTLDAELAQRDRFAGMAP